MRTVSLTSRPAGLVKVILITVALVLAAGILTTFSQHGTTTAQAATSEPSAHNEASESHGDDPGEALIGEFRQDPITPWLEFKVGPIDLSITKAVVYLWLTLIVCCGFAIWQARRMAPKPNRKQTAVEVLYGAAHDQMAGSTLGDKIFSTYFPYVATLFFFIWVCNLVSFIPLPFGEHSALGSIRDFGLYAATSNINVTITLTLMTIGITHYLGVKHNGLIGYLKSWAPSGTPWFGAIPLWLIHAIGEFVKVLSLSVRLFANMLTGHLLILVMFTIIFVVGKWEVGLLTVPVALAFFLFEVVLVAVLQAFIFAVLSGVYMGSASAGEH